MTWPVLREEISLLQGPRLADGQPSWTLHDPVRNRFFSIDWPSFEILKRWSYCNPSQIAVSVTTDTTLHLSADDIANFAQFLTDNQLVQSEGGSTSREFAERLAKMQGSSLKWLMHNYLFFRVPLWNPDVWLRRWMGFAGVFFTPTFAISTLLALVVGVFQVTRQWDGFVASLVDMFTWSGLATYGLALVVVKWLHELGHAFTARRLGCRVPAMGVAFLLMFPMAYTDTNETWRLTNHRKRLQIASAGIITELMIAAWATLAWALLPDGGLRSVAFTLATTSLVATLAINASPFLRFDGYFVLSDLIDMPNLHERSFDLARWKLREWLFALGEPKPEIFSPRRERALIFFAWLTWLYRFVVFIAIAVLVYQFFFKLLGVLLFVVELAWFIVMPVIRELKEWQKRWAEICGSRRSWRTAGILLMLLAMLLLPWPTRVTTSGILKPSEIWPVFSPGAAYLQQGLLPAEGEIFEASQVLIRLVSPKLESERATVSAQVEQLRWQSATSGFDTQTLMRMQSLRETLATREAELASIDAELARYTIRAPFDGVLRDVGPDLAPGQWVADDERLALLVRNEGINVVETYLDEADVRRVKEGDAAIFIADGREGGAISLRVQRVDADATRELNDGMLAAYAGGHILTREQRGQLIPETAIYRVILVPDQDQKLPVGQSLRGDVVIRAEWESPLMPYVRHGAAVVVREFGF